MASTDSRPVPQKNVAYRVIFPILDADGDLVTGATGLDSEISKDCGTFADCTNEATEIATSSGMYYLDLTSTEMNADSVAIIVKTSSSGAKTTPIVLYPEEAGDIRVNVTQFGSSNLTAASGIPEVKVASIANNAITAASINADAITDAKVASDVTIASVTGAVGSVTGNVGGNVTGSIGSVATGGITAGSIAADAIGASELAADAVTEIQSGLATAANLATLAGYVDTEVAAIKAVTDQFVFGTANRVNAQVFGVETGAITAGAIAADAIGASELAADAVTEIQSGLATAANLATVAGYLDTEIAAILADTNELQTDLVNGGRLDLLIDAIKAKTDNLPSDPADASVVAGLIAAVEAKVDTIDSEVGVIDGIVDAIVADTNELQTDWANGGRLDLILDARASQSSVDTLATYVDTEVAAIKAKTDNLPSDPADASVIAGRFDTLDTSVADLPTNAELATALAGADDAVLAQVALVKAETDKLADTLEDDGGTYRFTTNALEQAPTGGSAPTVGEIADAVWDEATAGHTTSGTFGEQVKTDIDAVLADTNELQTDWVDGGRLDLILDARASQASVDDIPTNAELATALASADDAVLAQVALVKAKTDNLPSDPADASVIAGRFDTVDTNIADVESKVDDLESRLGTPSDLGSGASVAANLADIEAQTDNLPGIETKIDAIDDYIDTEMAAVLAAVDTEVAAIKAKTDNLPSDPADASVIAGRFDTLDTSVADLPTNSELATALAGADDAVLAAVAALNDLDATQIQTAAAAALAAYDPPTRTELTGDKDEVITQINANETKIDAVKAKTDGLTFTVAGSVDANIQLVNDVAVAGTGAEGDEWGPA